MKHGTHLEVDLAFSFLGLSLSKWASADLHLWAA